MNRMRADTVYFGGISADDFVGQGAIGESILYSLKNPDESRARIKILLQSLSSF